MKLKPFKAFTLIELLITMAIAGVIGIVLLMIIVNSGGLFYEESSKVQQGLNINDSIYTIDQNIRQASSVASSYTSGSTTYTSGSTELILKIASVDSSNNLVPNAFDYYIFFLDADKLRLKTFPDSQSSRKIQDQILSLSVKSLNFKYFDLSNPPQEVPAYSAQKVSLTIVLKQKSGAGFQTNTATSEANLRND